MKNKLFSILLLFLCSVLSSQEKEQKTLEYFLSQQKDLTFQRLTTVKDEPLRYELIIKQPIDWRDPEKGYFNQTVVLTHVGFNKPTLMETQGYQMYDRKNELQQMLNSNDLNIEHRYFGKSIPDSVNFDWAHLNLYNATNDLHHINQIFKKIYKEKWISTGISKGGQTSIYYKYFFPEDVDIAIPYVAPINYTLEDPRIYTFLETVGTEECRNTIKEFQIFLLQNEEEALKYIKVYSDVRGLTYDYLGSIGKAFEYSILEYSFSFWQWGYPCNNIPQNPTVSEAVDYLLKTSNIDFFSDKDIKEFAAHYYQAATEMGYYGYDITPFKSHIKYFEKNPLATFPPKEAKNTTYSSELNEKLKTWLATKANNIIYIYGETDTWSATQVVPSVKTNSVSLVLPEANHASAKIKNMDDAMKKKLSETLYKFIKIKPDYSQL